MTGHEPREETWLFGGLRVDRSGKYHAWYPLDEDGNVLDPDAPLLFAVKGSFAAGSDYAARVTRKDDGGVTRHGLPTYLRRHGDETVRARMQAQHNAAQTASQLKTLEANDKRMSAVEEALAPLLEISRSLPFSQRDAFVVYVMRRLR